jgi:hypothetical protein
MPLSRVDRADRPHGTDRTARPGVRTKKVPIRTVRTYVRPTDRGANGDRGGGGGAAAAAASDVVDSAVDGGRATLSDTKGRH